MQGCIAARGVHGEYWRELVVQDDQFSSVFTVDPPGCDTYRYFIKQKYLWNIAIQLAVGCSAYKLIYVVWVLTAREKRLWNRTIRRWVHVLLAVRKQRSQPISLAADIIKNLNLNSPARWVTCKSEIVHLKEENWLSQFCVSGGV